MNREEKQWLGWVKMYEQTHDAGLTCKKCGISRPTLRKWWRRYQSQGEGGLKSRSRLIPIDSKFEWKSNQAIYPRTKSRWQTKRL